MREFYDTKKTCQFTVNATNKPFPNKQAVPAATTATTTTLTPILPTAATASWLIFRKIRFSI